VQIGLFCRADSVWDGWLRGIARIPPFR